MLIFYLSAFLLQGIRWSWLFTHFILLVSICDLFACFTRFPGLLHSRMSREKCPVPLLLLLFVLQTCVSICMHVCVPRCGCVCVRTCSESRLCTQHSPLASCTARPELYLFLMPFAFANSFHKCCCCCCSYCCCCESCDCNTFCGRIKQKSSRRQQQQAANRKRNTTKTTTTMATLATLAMMMEMAQRGSGSGRETGIIPTRELKLPSLLICTNSRESERKKIQ